MQFFGGETPNEIITRKTEAVDFIIAIKWILKKLHAMQ